MSCDHIECMWCGVRGSHGREYEGTRRFKSSESDAVSLGE